MNIFILDTDPTLAAKYHVDKHVVKMSLELGQLLSTAHFLSGTHSDRMYKPTHINHPSALWVRESKNNYIWTWLLMSELLNEYTFRYDKHHKTQQLVDLLSTPISCEKTELTPPKLAMPDEYKLDNPVEAYRAYYNGDKRHLFKWKHRKQPEWIS